MPGTLAAMLVSGLTVCGLLGGCATSRTSAGRSAPSHHAPSPSPPPGRLTVTPATGEPTTAFAFTFTAPHAAGRRGDTRLSSQLAVLGPVRTGCVGRGTAGVPVATAGQAVTLTLRPANLGGVWCRGSYAARVSELQTPVCSANQMCPQFIRLVAIVARGRFRVRAP